MKRAVSRMSLCVFLSLCAHGAYAQATTAAPQCTGALVKEYWNKMHVIIVSGDLGTKPDDKPDTLEVVLVEGASPAESEISADGQIIYTTDAVMEDQAHVEALVMEALTRRIKAGSGVDCQA